MVCVIFSMLRIKSVHRYRLDRNRWYIDLDVGIGDIVDTDLLWNLW